MAPILANEQAHDLAKRYFWGWNNYGDGSGRWYSWGRWVLLGVIVGVALLFLVGLQLASCRRVRQGQRAYPGTSWMVPPSYYASQQQYNNNEYSLPTYKAEPGEGDAGHYVNGQFVPYQQPSTNNYDNYAPPEGPPPSQTNHYQPPEGPPPSHANFQPPAGPPPGHSGQGGDVAAPEPARFKN